MKDIIQRSTLQQHAFHFAFGCVLAMFVCLAIDALWPAQHEACRGGMTLFALFCSGCMTYVMIKEYFKERARHKFGYSPATDSDPFDGRLFFWFCVTWLYTIGQLSGMGTVFTSKKKSEVTWVYAILTFVPLGALFLLTICQRRLAEREEKDKQGVPPGEDPAQFSVAAFDNSGA